jgi:hypothetical protein
MEQIHPLVHRHLQLPHRISLQLVVAEVVHIQLPLEERVVLVVEVAHRFHHQLELLHRDLHLLDLHIHYHLELLLDMVLLVVPERVGHQTSVMVVAVVVPLNLVHLTLVPILLVMVEMEYKFLLEELLIPGQVVAVEDVGTLTRRRRPVEWVDLVAVLPVV